MYVPLIDLQEMYSRAKTDLDELSSKNVLLTGQTGFFGVWLLSLFSFYVNLGNHSPNLYIVSRRPNSFVTRFPEIVRNLKISWIESDIRGFKMPDVDLDYILHGASTSASETYNGISNLDKFQTIVDGTEMTLSVMATREVRSFLYLSSGAVYAGYNGNANLKEDSPIFIDRENPQHTLGSAKINAENLCLLYKSKVPWTNIKVARCFSFVGPHLPLDLHYAIGNFIQSSLKKRQVILQSNGRSIRSYMYISDATVWIIRSLTCGLTPNMPFHIGSETPVSIFELAQMVALETSSELIQVTRKESAGSPAPNYYVPSTALSQSLLEVSEWTSLRDSIRKTLDFYHNGY